MHEELQKQIGSLLRLLAEGQYDEIEKVTNGVRLPAEQIRSAVEQYGRTLVQPPSEAYELMDVVEVKSAEPPRWSITMPLWTKEEGRSDLSLEVTVIKEPSKFVLELDDIHVL